MHAQTRQEPGPQGQGAGLWAAVTDFARHPAARLKALRAALPGFRFAESMHGEAVLNGARHPMVFKVAAEAPDLSAYLDSGRTHLSGHVTIEGMVKEAPLVGDLWIKPLSRQIRYEFSFRDAKGRLLSFRGQKDIALLHPVRTLKTLPGEIRDEHGQKVAQARLRFRNRDLPSFLRSFRLM